MKKTSMVNKRFWLGMLILGITLIGCATTTRKTANPFTLEQNVNTATVQIWQSFSGKENFIKISGVEIVGNPVDIILPAGRNEYEVMFRANIAGFAGIREKIVLGKVQLDITGGKTYALSLEETTGSTLVRNLLDLGFLPPSVELIFHELSADLKKKTKITEFPIEILDTDAWETH